MNVGVIVYSALYENVEIFGPIIFKKTLKIDVLDVWTNYGFCLNASGENLELICCNMTQMLHI